MANPDEVAALLRSGKNVVTPVGWLYPSERSAAPMREAALEGNATLHGTGMAPGGISEKFPLLFSAFSTGVTFVRAEEFSDLRTYEAPDVLRHVMGFGEVPEKALTGPMQKMLDSGFIQAVKMCVDKMGFNADPKVRATQEIAVATAPIDSPLGVIEPGQVAGRKFHWEALVDGEPVVRVTVNWLMGEENLDPAWTFGPAGQRYEMEVRGNPDITIVVKGFHSEIGGEGPEYGIVGTAAHCVNSVPAVCAAEPGILTYLDLPLISGKAAPATRLVSGNDEAVGGRAVPNHRDGSAGRLPRHGPDAAAVAVPQVVRADPADQGSAQPDRRLGCRRAVTHVVLVGGGSMREKLTQFDAPQSFGYTLSRHQGSAVPAGGSCGRRMDLRADRFWYERDVAVDHSPAQRAHRAAAAGIRQAVEGIRPPVAGRTVQAAGALTVTECDRTGSAAET